jgi:hypothetical protein
MTVDVSKMRFKRSKKWREVPMHWVEPLWVGDFAELSPSDYGIPEFHGRFHPEIPLVMVSRYTKKGDVVWDPCAGGDTTGDVVREHFPDRKVISTDINVKAPSVKKADAFNHCLPDEDLKKLKLVIFHPPYYDIVKYSKNENDGSNQHDLKSYLRWLRSTVTNLCIQLKTGGHLVVVVGEIYKDKTVVPLEYFTHGFVTMRRDVHYTMKLKGRIIKDFGETKGGGRGKDANLWKYRCLKNGNWRLGLDTILVFKKEKV